MSIRNNVEDKYLVYTKIFDKNLKLILSNRKIFSIIIALQFFFVLTYAFVNELIGKFMLDFGEIMMNLVSEKSYELGQGLISNPNLIEVLSNDPQVSYYFNIIMGLFFLAVVLNYIIIFLFQGYSIKFIFSLLKIKDRNFFRKFFKVTIFWYLIYIVVDTYQRFIVFFNSINETYDVGLLAYQFWIYFIIKLIILILTMSGIYFIRQNSFIKTLKKSIVQLFKKSPDLIILIFSFVLMLLFANFLLYIFNFLGIVLFVLLSSIVLFPLFSFMLLIYYIWAGVIYEK